MNSKRLSELRYKGHITDSEYKELKFAIKALEESSQGEWIYDYTNGFGNKTGHCSECKYRCEHTKFCPNCGAKMANLEK